MISIILCTYNRKPLLPRAIHSVLQQSYHEWELIIIDDGSTDGTRSMIKKFYRTEKRIRYFFQRNKGLAAARNAGMKKARGEFITFIDSDDAYAKHHLQTRIEYMMNNRQTSMIHGGAKLIGPRRKQYVVDLQHQNRKIHLSRCHIGGTFFFRKAVVSKIKGFAALPFGEDFDFYSRAEKYFRIDRVNVATYQYHLESDNRLCDVFTEEMMKH